ncbi:LCP family protein [Bacillus sp. SG-1]|uniref:LCP family protein n=1 Tax=Bacillus sp. SG-1 TaxID=161544 RepID=UPI0002DC7854|nr:LCP family protein [Bacillus sp. SG-1]
MHDSRITKKSIRRKRRRRIIGSILLLIILTGTAGLTVFGFKLYKDTKNTTNKIYQELDSSNLPNNSSEIEITKQPFSILLVGIENQKGGLGRSDVLLLLTVNPGTHDIKMVSIPRDTLTYIPAAGIDTKIAHSYGYGGIEPTIEAINKFIDVPIDYYITTNFQGFEDIVDSLGGITVDIPFTFTAQLTGSLNWKTFYEGSEKLNGNEALAYVRMRKQDPKGDLGRNERQQQVMKAIVDKGTSFSTITKADDILEDLGNNVKTNIPPSKFISLVKLYSKIKDEEFNLLKLEGYDDYIDGVYYYVPDMNSIKEISAQLNETLL